MVSSMVTCQSPGEGREKTMTVEVISNGLHYTRKGIEVCHVSREAFSRLMAVRPSTGPEVGGTGVADGRRRHGAWGGALPVPVWGGAGA